MILISTDSAQAVPLSIAAPELEAHRDTFGQLNPIHWLFEALPSEFINTRNSAVARPYTCSISGGCAAQ